MIFSQVNERFFFPYYKSLRDEANHLAVVHALHHSFTNSFRIIRASVPEQSPKGRKQLKFLSGAQNPTQNSQVNGNGSSQLEVGNFGNRPLRFWGF